MTGRALYELLQDHGLTFEVVAWEKLPPERRAKYEAAAEAS